MGLTTLLSIPAGRAVFQLQAEWRTLVQIKLLLLCISLHKENTNIQEVPTGLLIKITHSHLLCSYDFIYCSLLTSGGYGFTHGSSLPGQKSGFDHSTLYS